MTQPNYTDITKIEALALIAEKVKRIKHFPLWLRNDKDIALLTVSKSGKYLQYMSEDLRNDREIVLYVVGVKGSIESLHYANATFKDDKQLDKNALEHVIEQM